MVNEIQKSNHLFTLGDFEMHSGNIGHWKIECDALTDADIECLAFMLSERLSAFGSVYGIPTGGERLATAMRKYVTEGPRLFVDDVLTTGTSMEQARSLASMPIIGAVIFARGPCPSWITPLFSLAMEGGTYSLEELELTENEARAYPVRPDEVHHRS